MAPVYESPEPSSCRAVPSSCAPLGPPSPEGGGLAAAADPALQTDAELLRSLAAGNRPALAALYDRHVGSLLTLAQRLLGGRSDAEDLVRDLFLEVWQRADTYDPTRASVRTWLLLRLRSRALDRLKSAAWRQAATSKPLSGPGAPPAVTELGRPTDPDEELILRATQASVHGAMRLLSQDEQQLLDLVYIRGITLAAAAGELSAPLGTVKSRLNRVLGKLRSSLAQASNEV